MRSIGGNCSTDKTCCILGRQYSNKWIQVGLLQRKKICRSWGNWEVLGLGWGSNCVALIVSGFCMLPGTNICSEIWKSAGPRFWKYPFGDSKEANAMWYLWSASRLLPAWGMGASLPVIKLLSETGSWRVLCPKAISFDIFSGVESSRDMRVPDKSVCARPDRQCSNLANIQGWIKACTKIYGAHKPKRFIWQSKLLCSLCDFSKI